MLIALRRRFLFVANLKAASSSIETALAPHAEIRVSETRLGKHLPLEQIALRYDWLLEHYPLQRLFVFGVLRDPLAQLVSLYNFHQRVESGGRGRMPSTRGLDFDDFVRDWSANSWQAQGQHRLFQHDGCLALDALLDHARLAPQFEAVAHHLGVRAALPHVNRSGGPLTAGEVSEATRAFVAERYAEDYALLARCAGRYRTPDGWRPLGELPPSPDLPPPPSRWRGRLRRLLGGGS